MEFRVIAEEELPFKGEKDRDWLWCMEHATFRHKEACEFIIHITHELDDEDGEPYWKTTLKEMEKGKVSATLRKLFKDAAEARASALLVYS